MSNNVDEMSAGQEMDALLAERVMGWAIDRIWCSPDGKFLLQRDLRDPKIAGSFCPSRSMQAAWEVVEFCMRRGLGFQLMSGYPPGWIAWFGFGSTLEVQNIDAQGSADTAPLAICRAALKTRNK